MKEIFRSPKGFIFSVRHFLIPSLTIAFLLTYSLVSLGEPNGSSVAPTDSSFADSFFDVSLTDVIGAFTSVILAGLAVYAIWKKPWRENLAVHFKRAYRAQLKFIQKAVKERDALREEHPDSDANIMGKQLWQGNKDNLIEGLEEIENIKTSKDVRRISNLYVSMLDISWFLGEEIQRLQDLKSLSKTGEINGKICFTNEFAKKFPRQRQFDIRVRLKPEYIIDGHVSQFWLWENPFHPYDPDTGRKVKKRHLPRDDHWWLLSMNSPYWKYVLSVILDLDEQPHLLNDGRRILVPPTDFLLPDGSRLLGLKGRTLFPMRIERDGETC